MTIYNKKRNLYFRLTSEDLQHLSAMVIFAGCFIIIMKAAKQADTQVNN